MKLIKILLFLFVVSSSVTLANVNNDIRQQKRSVREGIGTLQNMTPIITADMFSADQIIKELVYLDKRVGTLVLVLPDVNILRTRLEKISEKADNVVVFFLEKQSTNKYFKKRAFVGTNMEKITKKVTNLKNITIYTINPSDEELNQMFELTFTGNPYEADVYKKYIGNFRNNE